MARIGISLLSDDNPRLKVESYFAVTSNTRAVRRARRAVCGGGRLQRLRLPRLRRAVPVRSVPLHRASSYGGIALREGTVGHRRHQHLGAAVRADARGMRAARPASPFCSSISASTSTSRGAIRRRPSQPAPKICSALLQGELADTRNWRADLPAEQSPAREPAQDRAAGGHELLVIHPAGVLTFSQRSLPLEDYLIEKFGNQEAAGRQQVQARPTPTPTALPIPRRLSRACASSSLRRKFTELSDSDKLSRQSFEQSAERLQADRHARTCRRRCR